MVTTVVKKVGSAGAGRDYSTWATWEAACPSDLTTGGTDQIWRGEGYNDSEFLVTSGTIVDIGGTTTDATHYKEMTAAAGQSFVDNASAQTNALAYNASNGVGLRDSGVYWKGLDISDSYFRINRLQISSAGPTNTTIQSSQAGLFIDKCIVENTNGGTAIFIKDGSVTNTLAILRGSTSSSGIVGAYSSSLICVNCTVVRPSNFTAGGAAYDTNGSSVVLKNCAAFGFSNEVNNSTKFVATTCYTDKASPMTGFTTVAFDTSTGSGFQQTTDTGRDYRIKSTSAFKDAGTTDSTNAATDIVGTTRPQGSAYDVGAWEYVVSGGGVALTGQTAAFNTGAVSPALGLALAGRTAAFSVGAVAPGLSTSVTGQSAAFTTGTVVPSLSKALTGQTAAFTAGTVSPSITVAITGQTAGFSAGTVTPTAPGVITLTGQTAAFSVGTLAAALSLALGGQSAAFSVGSVSAVMSLGLAGQTSAFSVGAVTPSITVALSGNTAGFSVGALQPTGGNITVALTGNSAGFSVGQLGAPDSAQNSGGYPEPAPKKTNYNFLNAPDRKRLDREQREELGILPKAVQLAVKAAARKATAEAIEQGEDRSIEPILKQELDKRGEDYKPNLMSVAQKAYTVYLVKALEQKAQQEQQALIRRAQEAAEQQMQAEAHARWVKEDNELIELLASVI